jgi:hypothetical protein
MKEYTKQLVTATACVACFSNPANAELTTQVIQTINSQSAYMEMIDGYGNTAAWEGPSLDGTYKVYYWDGHSVQIISPANQGASKPSLYNGKIAFLTSKPDFISTVNYWDGTYNDGQPNIIEIADGRSVSKLSLYSGRIAWSASDGHDAEVFYWDGTYTGGQPNISQLTDNDVNDYNVEMDDNMIVWSRGNTSYPWNHQIAYWDGIVTQQLDLNGGTYSGGQLSVHNGGIAWAGHNAAGYRAVNYWDGTFDNGTPNITTVNQSGVNIEFLNHPSLHDGKVVYVGAVTGPNPMGSIYYWDGTNNTLIAQPYAIGGWTGPSLTSTGIFYIGVNPLSNLHEVRYVTSTGICL